MDLNSILFLIGYMSVFVFLLIVPPQYKFFNKLILKSVGYNKDESAAKYLALCFIWPLSLVVICIFCVLMLIELIFRRLFIMYKDFFDNCGDL